MPSCCHLFFVCPCLFLLIACCFPSFTPYQPHWPSFCPSHGLSSSPAQDCLTCCFLCKNIPPPDCCKCSGFTFPRRLFQKPTECCPCPLSIMFYFPLLPPYIPSDMILSAILAVHIKRIRPLSCSWFYLLCLACGRHLLTGWMDTQMHG